MPDCHRDIGEVIKMRAGKYIAFRPAKRLKEAAQCRCRRRFGDLSLGLLDAANSKFPRTRVPTA
jgi:hypothetical protein